MSFNKDWLGSLPMSKITSIRVDFSRKLSWEVHKETEDRKKEPVRNYDTSGAMSPRGGPSPSPAPPSPASQSDSANKPVLFYRRGESTPAEEAQTTQRSATLDSPSSQGFSKPPGPKQLRSNSETPERSEMNALAARNEANLLRQESAPRLIAKQPVNATRFNKTDFAAPTSPTPGSPSSSTPSSAPTGFSSPVSPTGKNSQATQMQSATTVPRLGQVYAKPKPVGVRKSLIASGRASTLPLPLSEPDPFAPPSSSASASSSSPTSPQGSPPILNVTLSSSAPLTSSFPPPHAPSSSSSSPTSSPSPGARVAQRKKIVCPTGPPPPRPSTPGGPLNTTTTSSSSQTNDLRRHLQRSPSAVETRSKDHAGPPSSLLVPQADPKRPGTPRSNMLSASASGNMERARNPTVMAKARPSPPPPPPSDPAPLTPDEEAYEIFAHVARNVEPQISYSTPSASTLEAMESPDRLGIRFNNRFRPLSFLVIGGLNTIRPGGPGSSSSSSSSSSTPSSFSSVSSLTAPGSPGTRPLRNAAGKRFDLDPPK